MLKEVEHTYEHLKKDLQALKRKRYSHSYRAAHELARNVYNIAEEARRQLKQTAPEKGWEIVDALLRSDKKLLYSVDDSGGVAQEVFRLLPEYWMELALECRETPKFWLQKIERLVKEDEWGYRAQVLENSAKLLGEEALLKLASHFEGLTHEAISNLKSEKDFDQIRHVWRSAGKWGSCARALKDPFMYEKAEEAHYRRKPEGRSLLDVIKFFIKTGHYDEAEKRCESLTGGTYKLDQVKLLQEIYSARGDGKKLIELAKDRFECEPIPENLNDLVARLSKTEAVKAKARAAVIAKADGDIFRGIRLLLELGKIKDAEQVLMAKPERVQAAAYPGALNLIEDLNAAGSRVGVVLCYRALLWDILDRGFYKGYKYAARYFKTLAKTDSSGMSYPKGVEPHGVFLKKLKEKHGLKSSFWKRVED